jgi:hypothetical protein
MGEEGAMSDRFGSRATGEEMQAALRRLRAENVASIAGVPREMLAEIIAARRVVSIERLAAEAVLVLRAALLPCPRCADTGEVLGADLHIVRPCEVCNPACGAEEIVWRPSELVRGPEARVGDLFLWVEPRTLDTCPGAEAPLRYWSWGVSQIAIEDDAEAVIPAAEGTSWCSEEEAREMAEAIATVLARRRAGSGVEP